MDAATASAVAALAIAIVALLVALAQALQQYFITGQLIRLCDSVVFGDLPGHGRRVWKLTQLRFRVVYEIPQIGLPPELWPSSTTASLARNNGAFRNIMKLERKPTLSASPILADRLASEPRGLSRISLPWNTTPTPTRLEGEASWALFCRTVYHSCRESILLGFLRGDADRCPAELPTVPMPASLRDIVVMALMSGMECTAASFEKGSVSMQGEAGTITSAQHPILGPLIHFSPRNMDVRHGVGSHGAITKEWLWRVMDNCIVADSHYNGRGRRAVEMEIGRFRRFGPHGGKILVPVRKQKPRSKRRPSSIVRRGSFERRRPPNLRQRSRDDSQERGGREESRPRQVDSDERNGAEKSSPRPESPQRPIPGTDGHWTLIPTAASDLPRNMYIPMTSNEPPRPDFRTFKASQELRNKKASEKEDRVRVEILKRQAEQRDAKINAERQAAEMEAERGYAAREARWRRERDPRDYDYYDWPSSGSSESAIRRRYQYHGSPRRRSRDRYRSSPMRAPVERVRVERARVVSSAWRASGESSEEYTSSDPALNSDADVSGSENGDNDHTGGEASNDNTRGDTEEGDGNPSLALVKARESAPTVNVTHTNQQTMALVFRKTEPTPPPPDEEQHQRDIVLWRAKRERNPVSAGHNKGKPQRVSSRLRIGGPHQERSDSDRERNHESANAYSSVAKRPRSPSPSNLVRYSPAPRPHRRRTYRGSPQRDASRHTRRDDRHARETELSKRRAERNRISALQLGNMSWFWLSQTDILPGFWATPWRSFQDLNRQVCLGAISVLVEAISAVTGGDGLLFSEYPPPPSSPMSNNLRGTVDWLHSGKSTFPAYAYNSRGGVVCSGVFSSVTVPKSLFANPVPAVELLFAASPLNQSTPAFQGSQPDVERRLVELMRLDAWLSIVGRTGAIRDGPSGLLIQAPAVVRSLIETFELDFLDADTSSLEGGAQVNKAVAASVVDNLEGNTLVGAEVLYALVATLRAVKVGECVLTGPDTAMLAEILEKDVQVSLV